MTSHTDARRWAEQWIEEFNNGDLDAVLERYRDDVRFESPVAELVTGRAVVEGKAALRQYWTRARGATPMSPRRFELDHVVWDPDRREMGLIYVVEIFGRRRRACELVTLDRQDRVVRGDVCYGSTAEGLVGAW